MKWFFSFNLIYASIKYVLTHTRTHAHSWTHVHLFATSYPLLVFLSIPSANSSTYTHTLVITHSLIFYSLPLIFELSHSIPFSLIHSFFPSLFPPIPAVFTTHSFLLWSLTPSSYVHSPFLTLFTHSFTFLLTLSFPSPHTVFLSTTAQRGTCYTLLTLSSTKARGHKSTWSNTATGSQGASDRQLEEVAVRGGSCRELITD